MASRDTHCTDLSGDFDNSLPNCTNGGAIKQGRTTLLDARIERVWARTRELRPIIEAHRGEGEFLRRLPDAIGQAFLDANVYRLLVPEEMGGEGVDPITYYDLAAEVSSYDGSTGWNYAIGATGGSSLAVLPPNHCAPSWRAPIAV
jgi:alkylation response protein AidB-like acyl-CoA dehydrogenase